MKRPASSGARLAALAAKHCQPSPQVLVVPCAFEVWQDGAGSYDMSGLGSRQHSMCHPLLDPPAVAGSGHVATIELGTHLPSRKSVPRNPPPTAQQSSTLLSHAGGVF